MTIVEALKNDEIGRVSRRNRWMYWDDIYEAWMVAEHKSYARETKIIYQGKYEEAAVEALLND